MTKEEYIAALPIAKKQYDRMFNDLVTGIENSINNLNGEAWRTALFESKDFIEKSSYYQGKRDACKEIAFRINKEYEAQMPNEYKTLMDVEVPLGDTRYADAERVFPDIIKSRAYSYERTMRHRMALAEMLKHYFMEGYRLGCNVNKTENIEVKPFNPDEFADMCSDAIIHPIYLKEIKDREQRDRAN